MQVSAALRPVAPHRIYRIDDLVRLTGFSARVIRSYTNRRIIPNAFGRGPSAFYTDMHLAALQRIARERDMRRTLEDWREFFNGGDC